MHKISVFIGRFSPFHLGHEEVLLRALKSSEVVLLLVGSAGAAQNIKNPFTYGQRKEMIRNWYECRTDKDKLGILDIRPIYDHPYNDQKWIEEVQAEVLSAMDFFNIDPKYVPVLTGAERDASTWYLKAFGGFFRQDFIKETLIGFSYSATELRDDYFSGGMKWEYKAPEATLRFLDSYKKSTMYQNMVDEYAFVKRYKEAWKDAPYAPTFVTVDTCVVQSGHVLVVTRAAQPGKGLWALPGGFVEQKEKLVDAAIRELNEETSIGLSMAQLYGSIVDKEIFDHPDRSLRGRTITTCFLLKLNDTKELPKIKAQPGEVANIQWLPIAVAKANPSHWFEDHHAMMCTMVDRIRN